MAESGNSLFERIRSAKNSLENAEQSFMDNKSMRGELDLMLAEAELKNLRRKKDVPWNWNRQLLAMCGAALLVIAGLGGWMFAKGEAEAKPAVPVSNGSKVEQPVISEKQKAEKVISTPAAAEQQTAGADIKNNPQTEGAQAPVSSAEMRQLVRSARVELSKTK